MPFFRGEKEMKIYNRYNKKLIGEFDISPNADLRWVDLQMANLKDINLQGVNLQKADLRGVNFHNAIIFPDWKITKI